MGCNKIYIVCNKSQKNHYNIFFPEFRGLCVALYLINNRYLIIGVRNNYLLSSYLETKLGAAVKNISPGFI